MRKPDFFIVGAPKCGTSAMYNYLKQHPQIFMPERKEPRFFSSDLDYLFSIQDEGEYLALFAEAANEKRIGEASPSYFYSGVAAEKIGQFCPEASIIVMLRNPVDAMYSLHKQRLYHGLEKIEDFESALWAEDNWRPENFPLSGDIPSHREAMRYSEQLQRYIDVFGWENIHVIVYDDFKGDVVEEYRRTLRFLGVDEGFRPEFKVINSSKKARSRALRTLLRDRQHPARQALKATIPRKIGILSARMLEKLNTKHEERPAMDPELRKQLQKEFRPEIERLSELLGRDLTHWSRD